MVKVASALAEATTEYNSGATSVTSIGSSTASSALQQDDNDIVTATKAVAIVTNFIFLIIVNLNV
jgi:hypothetical protein